MGSRRGGWAVRREERGRGTGRWEPALLFRVLGAGRGGPLCFCPRLADRSARIDESSCLLQGDGWVYFNPLWKAH